MHTVYIVLMRTTLRINSSIVLYLRLQAVHVYSFLKSTHTLQNDCKWFFNTHMCNVLCPARYMLCM